VPNLAARQLKSSESGIVGVLLADLRNSFYAEVASGIEEVLASSEYYMVLATDHHRLDREDVAVRTFAAMNAGGVILTPSQVKGAVAKYLVARNVAVVELDDRTVNVARSATVLVDGVTGVRLGVEHLVQQGHRRIAAVLWDIGLQAGSERRDGYLEALNAAGIAVDDRIIRAVPDGTEAARSAARDLLANQSGFTAIIATNELVCLGVMEAIWEAGVRVPDDLSVVGFDDVPWMRTTTPPLTTVAQPTVEIGRFAAQAMISLLEGRAPDDAVTRLAPRLIVRGSVAAPQVSAKSRHKPTTPVGTKKSWR
jgi:LacI family transcriptional regulator